MQFNVLLNNGKQNIASLSLLVGTTVLYHNLTCSVHYIDDLHERSCFIELMKHIKCEACRIFYRFFATCFKIQLHKRINAGFCLSYYDIRIIL